MPLKVYNSFSKEKEEFIPINPPHVGMYVCGPTVSGESHLGHARPYITFDVVYRYLLYLGLLPTSSKRCCQCLLLTQQRCQGRWTRTALEVMRKRVFIAKADP